MDKFLEAMKTGVEGPNVLSWVRRQLREAGGFQMEPDTYKLLCEVASDLGESVFTDIQQVLPRRSISIWSWTFRRWENRYSFTDADSLDDHRVQNNRARTERAHRRLRRFTAPQSYEAPPVLEPPTFRSCSEASSRARQKRTAQP